MDRGRPGIYLLASYPKSGNTWVRALLEAWYQNGAVDINRMIHTTAIMRAQLFEDTLDVSPGDLTEAEIFRARPAMLRSLHAESAKADWHKCHDAFLPVPGGTEALIPPESLAGVILIVRDPRDVAPSLAAHSGLGLDDAIARMADAEAILGAKRRQAQVPQLVSSWSRFYESWLAAPVLRMEVVRYEDLLADPRAHLRRILALAGLDGGEERLARAVEAAGFTRLRRQEAEHGFREALPAASAPFFRQGRAGAWKNTLSPAQVARLTADHGPAMARFGYAV